MLKTGIKDSKIVFEACSKFSITTNVLFLHVSLFIAFKKFEGISSKTKSPFSFVIGLTLQNKSSIVVEFDRGT